MTRCEVPQEVEETFNRIGECFAERRGQECKELADDLLEWKGRGQNRLVYEVPNQDCVVKFAIDPQVDPDSNELEIETWKTLPENLEEYFAPVHDHGPQGTWLTMPELDTAGSREERIPWEEEEEFREALEEEGWGCSDIRPSNFGKTESGEWKFFDYPHCGPDIPMM